MKKRLVSILVCIFIFTLSINSYAFTLAPLDTENGEEMYAFFEQLMKVTKNQYRFDITYEELIQSSLKEVLTNHPEMFAEFAKGAYKALDENSSYLTADEYESIYTDTVGSFAGIGITVMEDEGKLLVSSPIDGTPASEAGISAGDEIISVNGEDVTSYGMDKIVSMIRGEEGTFVTIGILRKGEVLNFKLKREIIKVSPVSYMILDKNNAGYVEISSFNGNTSDDLKKALDDLKSKGVDKIILDLRDNLGGLENEAVKVVSYFIPDNSLVLVESHKNPENDKEFYSQKTDDKFKVVVLVNEYSASASEIVSGTIKDYKAGPLVGVTTFGKGTVQTSLKIKNNDAIWLTIAKYNLPNGENIHKIGIEPDYFVENEYESADYSSLPKINPERQINLGDYGEDVYAVKKWLSQLGYNIPDMSMTYDDETANVVRRFQNATGLYSYGVADFTTQEKIVEVVRNTKFLNDKQYKKALELIYNMK